MSLVQHYRNAVLYPSLVIILLSIIFSIIDNYNYKSEWLTAESVIFLSIVTAIVYSLIISALSLTIFLNKFEKVKVNNVLTALSWFLLPFVFITIVFIHEIRVRVNYEEEFGSDFIYVLILNIPFIVGLIWSYFRYRKINYRQQTKATIP